MNNRLFYHNSTICLQDSSRKICGMHNFIMLTYIAVETQSGLPLLPWSCYASVIQCDIIQYLMLLFYYNTGIISFLAIYNDTILCTIFCVRERLYAKKTLFFTCHDVALLFWVFCKHVCFSIHE